MTLDIPMRGGASLPVTGHTLPAVTLMLMLTKLYAVLKVLSFISLDLWKEPYLSVTWVW